MLASLLLGAPDWTIPACIAVAIALPLVAWSYWRAGGPLLPRLLAALFKAAAIALLAFCLLEPLFSGVRPRPGANLFLLVADDSRSLRVRDAGQRLTRGEQLARELDSSRPWQTRLSQDFDVRRYLFDSRLRPAKDFKDLTFEGTSSSLLSSVSSAVTRFHGRPNAGLLLFTDGRTTDEMGSLDWEQFPPCYPVVLGEDQPLRDIRVSRVAVTQTNFEAAPVTITAEVEVVEVEHEPIVLQLLDQSGKELQRVSLESGEAGKMLAHRFQFQPTTKGVSFYQVRAFAAADEKRLEQPERTSEATLENNVRWAVVDRGGGPYRVLYVGGRPNWEFKFLRRALQEDDEVDLVGLIRIAKKQPKFTFRGREGETTNPLFRGFGNQDDEQAEQFDQPVLLQVGTEDAEELRDGFPQADADLFRYHAVVLDDVEAAFFTQDQMSVLQEFVSQRGGGFLMLGGRESFAGGQYARTPIGELLPVYTDVPAEQPVEAYQLSLTKEGWLQPWVRVRATEDAEQQRLGEMPGFRTLNRVRSIKPGASVLTQVTGEDGNEYPALVTQRFGKGQAAALLVGDSWLWNLRRARSGESDLEQTWRQLIRWLVSDVPQRVEVETKPAEDDAGGPFELMIRVRDEAFRPLDNAEVQVQVHLPDGNEVSLPAEPSDQTAGTYTAVFTPRLPGPYRAAVIATAEDGSEIGRREAGWAAEPSTQEFQSLLPNRQLLETIAEKTGGEVLELDELQGFVSSLPNRKIPVTEPWIYPLWHQWSVFGLAIGCLIVEWGLRRWSGLP